MPVGSILQEFIRTQLPGVIATSMIGVTVEGLLEPFKEKFKKWFNTNDEMREYISVLINEKCKPEKVYGNIKGRYIAITGKDDIPIEFIGELKDFIIENKKLIESMNESHRQKTQNAVGENIIQAGGNITSHDISINSREG